MDFMFIFSDANPVQWFNFDQSLADANPVATGLSPATLPTKGHGDSIPEKKSLPEN